jgi:hypothetical protein
MPDADAFLDLAERQIAAPRKARMRAAEARAARKAAADEALAERGEMFRRWKRWRKERVAAVLNGPHSDAARELVGFLESMTLADEAALLAFVKQGPWREADSDTRFEILALVDTAIVRLRERDELVPIDDPLPDAPPGAFLLLREWLR